ncbi:acetyl-CoA carboxylase biotin carboxylase subunit [Myxococcota bacterium]|nr:acetyl-CoA carboxylase biotin carboxylase subunit [Myxococcota bacterium]
MPNPPFRKILVANRGEIALRVMRACREMGIATVAIYSEADRDARHVRFADEAFCVGKAASAQSYLRGEVVLDAARRAGAEAIHPGYGFLSENADFAQAVEDSGLVFVGPTAAAMRAMGDKVDARRTMIAAGVPVVPGTHEPLADEAEAARVAAGIGYPVMLKASAGGGGKGMRRVESEAEIGPALRGARSESRSSFGDDRVYMEKLVVRPRHVEVQVLSDTHGHHLHLFERDCSVQRRNQKVIEETPCPVLPEEVRAEMTRVATRAAGAIGYRGAGTVEFLYDARDQSFYFLEMNTRLQVEHPITEWVTGIDLVKAQLDVAAGRALPFGQEDVRRHGHAIECRIYAEDVEAGFVPSPGRIEAVTLPEGPWVRVDGAIRPGYAVPIHYDPMIAKLSAWGRDRDEAIARMRRALTEFDLVGIPTTIPFFLSVMDDPVFRSGVYATDFIPGRAARGADTAPEPPDEAFLAAALLAWRRERAVAPAAASAPTAAWPLAGRLRVLGRGR